MPCLLGCLALSLPRFVLAVVWLFSDYLGRAIQSNLLLFLGFLFLPLTTLTYAWAKNTYGSVEGIGLALVILAGLIDVGIVNFGRPGRRRSGGGDDGGGPPAGGPRDITITGQRVR
jgi:hypothetical protein